MKCSTRGLVLGALLIAPLTLVAQGPPPVRGEAVRQRIEQVFANRLRQELGLSADQMDKVGAVLTDWGSKRRGLEDEERGLRQALDGQLRPGVAANSDSVTRVIDRLLQNRVEYAQSFQGEMRDLAPMLTPVQRAQFMRLRDQVLRRVQDLQDQRPVPGRPVRPGAQ